MDWNCALGSRGADDARSQTGTRLVIGVYARSALTMQVQAGLRKPYRDWSRQKHVLIGLSADTGNSTIWDFKSQI